MKEQTEYSVEQVVYKCWENGNLRGLLLEHQTDLYDLFWGTNHRSIIGHCSRRWGKSSTILTIALEYCREIPNAECRFGAAFQKDVDSIIHPIMRYLTTTCPPKFKPYWVQSKGKYLFPDNDAHITISGLDEGRAENLRGTSMHFGGLDEGQNVDDLESVYYGVLLPQTLTTGGRIIMTGTTPRSPAHAFSQIYRKARAENRYLHRTIYDDSRPEIIAQIPSLIKEYGGEQSPDWRREFLCTDEIDSEAAILPEISEPQTQKLVIQEVERPDHAITYTVIDLGYKDFTGIITGFVDFVNGWKVIERCHLIKGKTSDIIAEQARNLEQETWGKPSERRYLDGTALEVADFNSFHNLPCTGMASNKEELDAMVNQMRMDVRKGRLKVHPRCSLLVEQMKAGIWDKNRRHWQRTTTFGHFDLLACAMYFVRVANLQENPYPEHYGLEENMFVSPRQMRERDRELKEIEGAFGLGD